MKAPHPAKIIAFPVPAIADAPLSAYRRHLQALQAAGHLGADQVAARLDQAADLAAVHAGLLRKAA